MELAADFTGMDTIKGTVSVDHYGILEGPGLTLYFIMQSVVLVNLAIMLFDVFSGIRSAVNEYWSLGEFPWGKLTEPFIDLSCASLVLDMRRACSETHPPFGHFCNITTVITS